MKGKENAENPPGLPDDCGTNDATMTDTMGIKNGSDGGVAAIASDENEISSDGSNSNPMAEAEQTGSDDAVQVPSDNNNSYSQQEDNSSTPDSAPNREDGIVVEEKKDSEEDTHAQEENDKAEQGSLLKEKDAQEVEIKEKEAQEKIEQERKDELEKEDKAKKEEQERNDEQDRQEEQEIKDKQERERIEQERKDEQDRKDKAEKEQQELERIEQERKDEQEREDKAKKEERLRERQQQQQKQRAQQQRYNSGATTEIVISLFGPSVGPCWGDFSCQHNHVRGRLYASARAVLFYSNLFGFEKRICLKYEDVVQMQLYRSTSIQVKIQDDKKEEEGPVNATLDYVFKGFSDRGQALQLLIDLWKKSEGQEVVESDSSQEASLQHPQRNNIPSAPKRSSSPTSAKESSETRTNHQEQQSSPPPNPPSILRSSKILSSDTAPDKEQTENEQGNSKRRAKSLPPPQRRKRERRNTIGAGSFEDYDAEDIAESTLDKQPSQEDLNTWEAAKKPADPCIKEIGIEPTVLPCSLDMFFNLFLADDAQFSMDEFMKGEKVQDLDVHISKWAPDATIEEALVRTVEFRHPVSQSLGVGPSHAPTKKLQRLRRYPGCGMCLRSSTTVEGIPGTDCFVVEDQWWIEKVANTKEDVVNHQVKFSARFGARFTKRSFLKGMILKSVRSGNKEWFEEYLEMVRSAVKDNVELGEEISSGDYNDKTTGLENGKSSEVKHGGTYYSENQGHPMELNSRQVLMVLSMAIVLLFILLLLIFNQLLVSQRTTEQLYEELKELRLEHGQVLSLLLEQQEK